MRLHRLRISNCMYSHETTGVLERLKLRFLFFGKRLLMVSALFLAASPGPGEMSRSSAAGNVPDSERASDGWGSCLEGVRVHGGLAWSTDASAIVFLGVPEDTVEGLGRAEGYPYILRLEEKVLERVPLVVYLAGRPRFSPDGGQLALCVKPKISQFLAVLSIQTGSLDTIAEYPGWKTDVSWSPGGRKMAFTKVAEFEELTDLLVYDMDTDTVTILRDNHVGTGQAVKRASWVPQSSRIAFIEGNAWGTVTAGGILYTIESDGTDPRTLIEPGEAEEIARFQYSIDGGLIAYELVRWDEERNRSKSEVWVCGGNGNNRRKLLGPDFHLVAFSPDGRHVLCDSKEWREVTTEGPYEKSPTLEFAGGEEEIFFVGVETGKLTSVRSIWTDAAWSPDGKMLAVVHGGRLKLVELPP